MPFNGALLLIRKEAVTLKWIQKKGFKSALNQAPSTSTIARGDSFHCSPLRGIDLVVARLSLVVSKDEATRLMTLAKWNPVSASTASAASATRIRVRRAAGPRRRSSAADAAPSATATASARNSTGATTRDTATSPPTSLESESSLASRLSIVFFCLFFIHPSVLSSAREVRTSVTPANISNLSKLRNNRPSSRADSPWMGDGQNRETVTTPILYP